nr:SGNH/GDSL hydrolase family protein [uncultured Rhodopila sp.]
MPEMMAIGDSLFNGVRSLTINKDLAYWSAPAQVARALGLADFVNPDYPRNVVINLEEWLKRLEFLFDLHDNIKFWDNCPHSSLDQFDNIAIASAQYADLWNRTADVAQGQLDALHSQLGPDFYWINSHLADQFFAFNTRFLLNPRGTAGAGGLSPLAIVTQRRPRRLLVSIGANNGLWSMGFDAIPSTGRIGGDTGPFNQHDLADLKELIRRLSALPGTEDGVQGVEHIYINALPLPSGVANLMPGPNVADQPKQYYFRSYENSFGFTYGTLSDAQAKLNDQTVQLVNALLRELAQQDARIHIVPIDAVISSYDFKHKDNGATIPIGDKILSNDMVAGNTSGWRGGLMGLDGMHPSIVGYAVMAQAILDEITRYEGVQPLTPPSFQAAYQADTMLTNLPVLWDEVHDAWLDIRRKAHTAPLAVQPSNLVDAAVIRLMKAVRFKTH